MMEWASEFVDLAHRTGLAIAIFQILHVDQVRTLSTIDGQRHGQGVNGWLGQKRIVL